MNRVGRVGLANPPTDAERLKLASTFRCKRAGSAVLALLAQPGRPLVGNLCFRVVAMTESYRAALPQVVLDRYDFAETRNAARILQATNPDQFTDLVAVLEGFALDPVVDLPAGGNESPTAARLNHAFRDRGWAEATYKVKISGELVLRRAGSPVVELSGETEPASYNVDNVKGRVALDVEWHAKDGNLDRDIAAYRSFYDAGLIDCAVMVTMTRESLRLWALGFDPSSGKFGTSTTTNLTKVIPKLDRGDGGGCPILIASICARTI